MTATSADTLDGSATQEQSGGALGAPGSQTDNRGDTNGSGTTSATESAPPQFDLGDFSTLKPAAATESAEDGATDQESAGELPLLGGPETQ